MGADELPSSGTGTAGQLSSTCSSLVRLSSHSASSSLPTSARTPCIPMGADEVPSSGTAGELSSSSTCSSLVRFPSPSASSFLSTSARTPCTPMGADEVPSSGMAGQLSRSSPHKWDGTVTMSMEAIAADEWSSGGRCIGARIRGVNVGILDEQVLTLVFRSIGWDPRALCAVARVSRRLRAVASRVLWRELCVARAPRMVAALSTGPSSASGRVAGGWPALAKLLLFCCGAAGAGVPGHLAAFSRFSKTSGRSFLSRRCAGDLLYVSDPCEHAMAAADDDDVGAYRGVFGGFMSSRTRACLVGGHALLEPHQRCPCCGAGVWSLTDAGLVPRSACRHLGAHDGRLEYFVCVSGHLHGSCWLARLSSSDGGGGEDSKSPTRSHNGGNLDLYVK